MSFASRDWLVQELTYLPSKVYTQGSKKKKTRLGLVDFLAMRVTDQLRFLGNCPPTPLLSQHFVPSEKLV